MLPAVSWSERADHSGLRRSVEGRLRERAGVSRQEAERRQNEPVYSKRMSAGDLDDYARSFARGDRGDDRFPLYSVAVFALCQPDSAPAEELRRRRAYFDIRTGDTWDVFFPGYYQYGSMDDPHAIELDEYWAFSPRAFDTFRRDLERETNRRWRYSGGSDLVLLNAVVDRSGAVTVDYDSVISGPMTDSRDGARTLTLAQVIEAISTDLESQEESSTYGVGKVVAPQERSLAAVLQQVERERASAARDTAVATAGAVLGEIGSRILGLR